MHRRHCHQQLLQCSPFAPAAKLESRVRVDSHAGLGALTIRVRVCHLVYVPTPHMQQHNKHFCLHTPTQQQTQIRGKLKQLKLSNKAVWDRERAREAAGGAVDTPWFVKAVYYPLCVFLDVAFDNRCGCVCVCGGWYLGFLKRRCTHKPACSLPNLI